MQKIIAAVRDLAALKAAAVCDTDAIFFLCPDLREIKKAADLVHKNHKKLYIHIDLASGIGKDKSGIEFAAALGVDGIISTRAALIRAARECGLLTVQRFFIVDSHSIETTVETLSASKADFIEVMPGIAPKIIEKLKNRIETPIIAGGLIETTEEAESAISAGAYAVSTGKASLWKG